ncbi:MAG TPA: amidohydrolase [Bacillales bacterium]|nr:amidohydrolase [Bacillales bacterium]
MKADLILKSGQIVSMDEDDRQHEALAVYDGKIIALGSDREVVSYEGHRTEVVDLNGKTVLPGFIDAHQHMISTGFNLRNVDCRVGSIKELVDKITTRAETCAPGEWVIGWGYDESRFAQKRHPSKADFAGIDRPVFVTHYSLHSAVANDAALEAAGISAETTVEHGMIEKDEHGELTGRLTEDGLAMVKNSIPYTIEQMKEALKLANDHYVKQGVTSVHEAGMGFFTGSFDEFRAFQETSRDGSRKVRVYGMVLDDFFEQALEARLTHGFGNDRLKIGAMKTFADGTVSGKSAAVTEPYTGEDGSYGELMQTDEEIGGKIVHAHRNGYQIAVHAIGDAAVEQVLNAYEHAMNEFPRSDCRHRIEHASVTRPDLIEKMRRLGIVAVPQPGLVHFAGEVHMEHLHPRLRDYVFASRSFMDSDLKVAGSSDSPITPCEPLLGIYTSISRKTANGNTILSDQKVTIREALEMYTKNAAYASFDEATKGTLEAGKLADLTVLPEEFLDFSADQIKETKVEMTIIGGEVVFKKGEE